jgi:hypothetical protein
MHDMHLFTPRLAWITAAFATKPLRIAAAR